jgi:deoxyribonuclease V
MILAVDVAYAKEAAVAGGVLFRDWTDEKPLKEFVVSCAIPDKYIPGRFYLRELPCIAALLQQVSDPLDFIVIDGFVYLGSAGRPGLGKHLRDMLEQKVAVIGVAKTPFRDTPQICEVLRGKSRKPLYISADGIDGERAKFLIRSMHGMARIPALLSCVDRLCRAYAGRLKNLPSVSGPSASLI